uniref:Uncharacterized protein n=1 Tax=Arundo donax TaxID=35708 RepID=A0A0A9FWJ2_ARUDO
MNCISLLISERFKEFRQILRSLTQPSRAPIARITTYSTQAADFITHLCLPIHPALQQQSKRKVKQKYLFGNLVCLS